MKLKTLISVILLLFLVSPLYAQSNACSLVFQERETISVPFGVNKGLLTKFFIREVDAPKVIADRVHARVEEYVQRLIERQEIQNQREDFRKRLFIDLLGNDLDQNFVFKPSLEFGGIGFESMHVSSLDESFFNNRVHYYQGFDGNIYVLAPLIGKIYFWPYIKNRKYYYEILATAKAKVDLKTGKYYDLEIVNSKRNQITITPGFPI